MEDRRKIVVQLNSEPETPHFDAEETLLSARPVVPIAPAAAAEGFKAARAPFYKRSAFLALVVITAVGIGLAAGLSIARYRYQPEDASTTAAQPAQATSASDTRTATVQTPKNQQAPTLPEVKVEEKSTVSDTVVENNEKADTPAPTTKVSTKAPEGSREKSSDDTDDNVRPAKPEPRDRKRASDDDESDTYTPRAQRRERRSRNRDENTVDVPRRIERAGEQINRIREIFEGSQQRP